MAHALEKQRPESPDTVEEVLAGLARACLLPTAVDPIQWLESVRWLSPESSHEIGPFRFNRAPYLEEPQRAILDPNVREVVLDWASQCGKSELWLNGILYWSEHAPSPVLLVGPDWKSVKSLSADRIRPMFRTRVSTIHALTRAKALNFNVADREAITAHLG
jgi:phage terminase large subunit GpA-like protein